MFVFKILEQAASRLSLAQAPRRLYTSNGTLVLDADDIVDWARDQWVKDARRAMKEEARGRKRKEMAENAQCDEGLRVKILDHLVYIL